MKIACKQRDNRNEKTFLKLNAITELDWKVDKCELQSAKSS